MARTRASPLSLEEMLHTLNVAFKRRLCRPWAASSTASPSSCPFSPKAARFFPFCNAAFWPTFFTIAWVATPKPRPKAIRRGMVRGRRLGATQPIVDRHTLMVLYTPQIEEAKDFFRQLRWILERNRLRTRT